MDKLAILNTYNSLIDSEGLFIKTLDQLIATILYHESHVSDFLTPDLVFGFEKIAALEPGIDLLSHGGFEGAERKKLFFVPDYLPLPDPFLHIGILEVSYQNQFNQLGHPDLLGALMGLGLKRSKLGDIVVKDSALQVAIDQNLVTYCQANLTQVGRAGVKVKSVDIDDRFTVQSNFKLISGTVKSLRLDTILALAYHLSRKNAAAFITGEKVKVNYLTVTNPSKTLKPGDLISTRQLGRFYVEAIEGETRKERIRLSLKLFVKAT